MVRPSKCNVQISGTCFIPVVFWTKDDREIYMPQNLTAKNHYVICTHWASLLQLQSPDFLKSGKLQIFLKQLHAAKKRGMTGKKLYQEIIEPRLPENKEVSSSIRSMIW